MSFEVNVRPMAETDLPSVLAIQAACYTEVAPESRESLLSKLQASPSTCFVAENRGSVIGYLISLQWQFISPPTLNMESCQLPQNPDCLYLHDLAVSPSGRSFGAGRALVQAFLGRLKVLGFKRASLIAVQDSAGYWERFGFRTVVQDARLREKLLSYGPNVEYMEMAM